MWKQDYKESWAPKNWCFWTVVLEKTLKNPLDWKEIQPVHPKGNQSWVFIGRTDVETEILILWLPDAKNWLIGKNPDAGKDCRWIVYQLSHKRSPGKPLVSSVAQSCPALCDPRDCSTPGLPVHHHLPQLAQTNVHGVSDAIQPYPLFSPSPPAFNLSQHQGLFQWVSYLH